MKLPQCPHCGHKLNFVQASFLKREGEYWCEECGGFSNVFLEKPVYLAGIAVVCVEVLLFLVYLLFLHALSFWLVFLMLLPYLIFQCAAPFLIDLQAQGARRPPSPPRTAQEAAQRRPATGTYTPPVRRTPPAGAPRSVRPAQPVRRPVAPRAGTPAGQATRPPVHKPPEHGSGPHIRHL